MKLFNRCFSLSTSALWPWNRFTFKVREEYTCIGMGRFMLFIDQYHLREIEVHKDCGGMISNIGSDGISYCNDCECIVEGDTEFINENDFYEN